MEMRIFLYFCENHKVDVGGEERITEAVKQQVLQSHRNILLALSHNSICHEPIMTSDTVWGAGSYNIEQKHLLWLILSLPKVAQKAWVSNNLNSDKGVLYILFFSLIWYPLLNIYDVKSYCTVHLRLGFLETASEVL